MDRQVNECRDYVHTTECTFKSNFARTERLSLAFTSRKHLSTDSYERCMFGRAFALSLQNGRPSRPIGRSAIRRRHRFAFRITLWKTILVAVTCCPQSAWDRELQPLSQICFRYMRRRCLRTRVFILLKDHNRKKYDFLWIFSGDQSFALKRIPSPATKVASKLASRRWRNNARSFPLGAILALRRVYRW